jgi:hypothetical protein
LEASAGDIKLLHRNHQPTERQILFKTMTPEECSRINFSLVRRISNNDPNFTSISIASYRYPDDDGVDDEGNGAIVPTSHEEWAELARAIGQSRQVKSIYISDEWEFSARNLGTLFTGLRSNTSIEEIHFSTSQLRCPLHNFAAFVENNPSLLKLHIDSGCDISAAGMQHLTSALSRGTVRSIKSISFQEQGLTDLALAELCAALRIHPQLEELNICINSPRRQCCVEIASMLRNQNCWMKYLTLCRCGLSDTECIILANALVSNKRLMRLILHSNNIGHEGINAVANSLANNSSLRELEISGNPGYPVTQNASGWDAFSRTIGGSGAQTINDTYMSNHTLWMIEPGLPSEIVKKFPSNVCEFLQLNRNCDKKFVARAKIFKNHFDGDFDLHLFQSMKVKILPHVLQWVGGDCAVEDDKECDVNSDTIGSENVEDHDMGSGSDEIGIDEARSVNGYGVEVEVQWQDWWYDNSPLPDGWGEGSYEDYRRRNISPPRPEFNRLSIIYRIVRHVPLVLIERGA